jgi:pimeloyl-ACP methyl ester carboxylesterase
MAGLNVEIHGSEEHPALVLLHGFLSSNLQWSPNREALQKHFRLVETELWGHGSSPAPRDPDRYAVSSYLSELEALRGRLGIDSWFVCGQSFGAGIAIRYALAHPRSVRALIVTNSRSALNDVTAEGESHGTYEAWKAMDLRALPFHPCHATRFPTDLKARMEEAADRIDPFAVWQAARTTAKNLSCRSRAAEIGVPTLLVNGRWEKVFQPDREFAAATIPALEVADLDAGHSVNIEAADEFNEAVIGFAARHAVTRNE